MRPVTSPDQLHQLGRVVPAGSCAVHGFMASDTHREICRPCPMPYTEDGGAHLMHMRISNLERGAGPCAAIVVVPVAHLDQWHRNKDGLPYLPASSLSPCVGQPARGAPSCLVVHQAVAAVTAARPYVCMYDPWRCPVAVACAYFCSAPLRLVIHAYMHVWYAL